jgi:transcriptional regulator with XRE-family HTH domain
LYLRCNVREYRKAAGFSQEGLALEAEVDRTYVSQIERGVCNPSLLVLHKLAMVLQVSASPSRNTPAGDHSAQAAITKGVTRGRGCWAACHKSWALCIPSHNSALVPSKADKRSAMSAEISA